MSQKSKVPFSPHTSSHTSTVLEIHRPCKTLFKTDNGFLCQKSSFNLMGEKCCFFFLVSVVLEVENLHDVGGSLRHRVRHYPQQFCAFKSSHPQDISSCRYTMLLFCSQEKSTNRFEELPGGETQTGG